MPITERSSETPFTFETSVEEVSQNLIGAVIITDTNRFIILQVRSFPNDQIKRSEFQEAKNSQPGTLTGSPYRGKLTFANISTADNGLVMPVAVRQINKNGETYEIEGPGKVAKALGIEQGKKYLLTINDPYSKILHLTSTSS